MENMIRSKLTEEENKNFKFLNKSFEEIKLPRTDLIVSNFALSFCKKNKFEYVWNEIKNSIREKGYFVGNIFGNNDEWKKKEMTFLSKKEVYELLNDFNIKYFKEKEFEGKTAIGKNKHWHVFYIIAQKK